jgi:(1->4)-alpha-D-glucan 1-alpha-D-glucosylmutase
VSRRAAHGERPRRRARHVPRVPLPLAAIPRATYRVQLHRDFGFRDLIAIVPYLAQLGISHVYCSPYLQARPGSRHGYDIVDHGTLNPEIGSDEDFARLVAVLAQHGMSHLCDVVPNHMAIMGADNSWWMDVLEHGPASAYADFFDIDWQPQDAAFAGKVLVPVLGDTYGTVLESGALGVAFEPDTGSLAVRYFEHRLPLDPREYFRVLVPALDGVRARLAPETLARAERIVASLRALPARDAPALARGARRALAAPLQRELAAVAAGDPLFATAVARQAAGMAEPASRDALHALLEAQAFRLTYWRAASDELNYRRFFDINDLAALRMESEAVFAATHERILTLAAAGAIGGLRIDHSDGLFDPAAYFERLQKGYRDAVARLRPGAPVAHGMYVVLEKISAPHERMPESWPVHGGTGYRFANLVNGLFVDTRALPRLDRIWRTFAGEEAGTLDDDTYRGKRVIMEQALTSSLVMLVQRVLRVARSDRHTRDFTFNALRVALREIVAYFPVYRTYVDRRGASEQDRRYVDWAVARTRARSRTSDPTVFDFLHAALLGRPPPAVTGLTDAYREFAMRAQQFTAPVTAKGVEDTAFYTFNRLVSLNEVGGDPAQFGVSVRAYHRANAERAAVWPHTLVATSTHDNKRSEDVRARIDVISELPESWRLALGRWTRLNRSRVRSVDGQPAPSRNDQYLLYQTLVGTLPATPMDREALRCYRERIAQYMRKAAREAKVHTSWLAANPAYEEALDTFVAELLRDGPDNAFLEDLRRQCATYAWFGLHNSLSATLQKLVVPGVPDFYQGTEVLDDSLVDPDNRRPVDFAALAARLDTLCRLREGPATARSLFADPADGRAKLWIILRGLALRHARPELFAQGRYRPMAGRGAFADHVVACARTDRTAGVVAVSGRMFALLGIATGQLPTGKVWKDTTVELPFVRPGTRLTDVLTGTTWRATGQAVPMAELCADFPCALLRFDRARERPPAS